MKNFFKTILLTVMLLSSSLVYARDTALMLSIDKAMQTQPFKEKLDPDFHFYFGKTSHPRVIKKFHSDISNKKTNAFNKSDEKACQWALLSTLLAFQTKAKALGANAVINIQSYYKKNAVSSKTDYECHAGALMAGVAIKGDIVKVGH